MTKIERDYLRSIYLHFNEKHNLKSIRTSEDLKLCLTDMIIFNDVVREVLSLGEEQDSYFLDEIFEENHIPILK